MSEHHDDGPHIVYPWQYAIVLMCLMSLMVATVVAGRWEGAHISPSVNLAIALLIAFGKVAFIMSFFMHVKFSSKLVVVFSTMAFVFMAIFFTLIFNDYATRETWHSVFVSTGPFS